MKYKKEQIKEVLNHDCFNKAQYFGGMFWEFLAGCLKELWKEGECFSGKRPICDSGWEYIAGEALAILEPKIGYYDKEDGCFIVDDNELYLKTFDWLINYIFKQVVKQ